MKCIRATVQLIDRSDRWSKLTRMEPLMLMAISGVREREEMPMLLT